MAVLWESVRMPETLQVKEVSALLTQKFPCKLTLDPSLQSSSWFSAMPEWLKPLGPSWFSAVPMVCVRYIASVMSDSATPWIVAHQAPLSLGFSRQEYWIQNTGVAIPSSRGSSWPKGPTHISWGSCIADGFFTTEPLGKALIPW